MPQHRRPFARRLVRGLRTSIRGNSAVFGYSIVVTADFAALSRLIASPSLGEIYLFIIGAVSAFALVEAVGTRMFSENVSPEPSRVIALGSAIGIVSISSAVGVVAGIGSLMPTSAAWPVGAFASSTVYLLIVAIEMAVAERAEKGGDDHEQEATDELFP